jgi:hypothetical protein
VTPLRVTDASPTKMKTSSEQSYGVAGYKVRVKVKHNMRKLSAS